MACCEGEIIEAFQKSAENRGSTLFLKLTPGASPFEKRTTPVDYSTTWKNGDTHSSNDWVDTDDDIIISAKQRPHILSRRYSEEIMRQSEGRTTTTGQKLIARPT